MDLIEKINEENTIKYGVIHEECGLREHFCRCHVGYEEVTKTEEQKVQEFSNKIFLLDLDGTTCDDIRNEDSHLYPTAKLYPNAKETINKWYDMGNTIVFFTARESKDKEVTIKWLNDNGIKFHDIICDKPRMKPGHEYVWVDNHKTRGITFNGEWTELEYQRKDILGFKK